MPDPAGPFEFTLPPAFVEQARRFRESGAVPVTPRLASTVVLLRDTPEGLSAYLLRRAPSMAFAGSMYAFPGGGVDPRDEAVHPRWAGPSPADWAVRLRQPEPLARGVVCAAVREVFEESGVLLAGPDEATVVGDVSGADWEAARVALIRRELGFAELLASQGLVLRTDLLGPWSRWITPEFEPRRYDTYFFVAALPTGQVTRDVGGEADRVLWAHPGEAADGRFTMLPPTVATLRELAAAANIANAFALAQTRDAGTPANPTFRLK